MSNMQDVPLLEQIDWFFTTVNWTCSYPNTMVLPLARTSSDHTPCVVSIKTMIPNANIFCFENYWVNLPGFFDCVKDSWYKPVHKKSSAVVITAKFKNLRHTLKIWHTNLSKVKSLTCDCNKVILCLDSLEEQRPHYLRESNIRRIVKVHLEELLNL